MTTNKNKKTKLTLIDELDNNSSIDNVDTNDTTTTTTNDKNNKLTDNILQNNNNQNDNNIPSLERSNDNNVTSTTTDLTDDIQYPMECPYLHTINRRMLDFDLEKICSITLQRNNNIYICLVCGIYLYGKAINTPVYAHSIDKQHYIYMNIYNNNIYCMPDNYIINDTSLNDIKYNCKPIYTDKQINTMNYNLSLKCYTLDNTIYTQGFIGLNNIKHNDWFNVIIQCISHITPIRNTLMKLYSEYDTYSITQRNKITTLLYTISELICKLYNPCLFKSHVTPLELLYYINQRSNNMFNINIVYDTIQFLVFILNTIQYDLNKTGLIYCKQVIENNIKGQIQITTQQRIQNIDNVIFNNDDNNNNDDNVTRPSKRTKQDNNEEIEFMTKITNTPYLYLSFNLPDISLFNDKLNNTNIIQQKLLYELLYKYNYNNHEIMLDGSIKQYQIIKLSKYLILHYNRFITTKFGYDKNNTLVIFPLQGLQLNKYCTIGYTNQQLNKMNMNELKLLANTLKLDIKHIIEKQYLIDQIIQYYNNISCTYNCISNIVHSGKSYDIGHYKIQCYNYCNSSWYELDDNNVYTNDTMAQQVALSEAYIQVYELQNT